MVASFTKGLVIPWAARSGYDGPSYFDSLASGLFLRPQHSFVTYSKAGPRLMNAWWWAAEELNATPKKVADLVPFRPIPERSEPMYGLAIEGILRKMTCEYRLRNNCGEGNVLPAGTGSTNRYVDHYHSSAAAVRTGSTGTGSM